MPRHSTSPGRRFRTRLTKFITETPCSAFNLLFKSVLFYHTDARILKHAANFSHLARQFTGWFQLLLQALFSMNHNIQTWVLTEETNKQFIALIEKYNLQIEELE